MKLPAPSGGDFTPAPEGSHVGVAYMLIDLGTQESADFTDKTKMVKKHEVLIAWELPNERTDENKPMSVHKRYMFSTHEKANLRKDLEGWRGKKFQDDQIQDFDLKNVLGKGCLLSIVHNKSAKGGTYANVAAVMALPKGMTAPQAENVQVYFTLDPFSVGVYEMLSDWLKELIAKAPEYGAATGKASLAGAYESDKQSLKDELDDDIPF